MRKICCLVLVLALFISCGNKKKDATDAVIAEDFTLGELAITKATNSKAKDILSTWPEFNALETSFSALYKVNSEESLSLVIEDLIEKQKLLKNSDYPNEFNIAQIKSRQNVFKTFIFKTKGDLEYGIAPQESVNEMVFAYNALRNQFNITLNNPLDIKALLEEEK
ncbi:MAG: hypothetical protein COA50_03585 [Flavobacteriaceae bacterium]|nr:MAG: hypothetical protein COA50_03585 [Flavobacteriaceae bacterium]